MFENMTQIKNTNSKPTSSISARSEEWDKIEKHAPCTIHGPNQTPHLDRQLQKPQTEEILHTILTALSSLVDEKQCTTCSVQTASTLLTGHARDIKTAKNGQWSKEDKKALKAEVKGLLKGIKKDAKGLWKEAK